MAFGVLSVGLFSTLLRLTAEGVVGVTGSCWKVMHSGCKEEDGEDGC